MPHEIYYTSAPEGLRPGDRGLCTVAATESIPRTLWDRLEALSGYRHNQDGPNPVSLAHWVLAHSGQNYHVLSRICDAGLDYTQRTNSFAHHIVLNPAELAIGGPAYMLSQPGLFADRWDGHVGPIVRSNPLPRGDVSPRVCSNWQSATGDAGWAGAVAQAISTSPWKPIGVVFAPGQDVMPLIAEVIALLPATSRWQATFNSYFTSLPGGMTCQWRCCLAGSPMAAVTLRAAAGSVAIDLTKTESLGAAPDGPWTQAARSGTAVSTSARVSLSMPSPKPPSSAKPLPAPSIEEESAVVTSPVARTEKAVVIHRRGLLKTQEANEDQASAPMPEFSWMAERRRARQRQLLILYAVACTAIVAGLWMGLWAYHTSADRPLPPAPASVPVVAATSAPAPVPEVVPASAPVVHRDVAPVIEKPAVAAPIVTRPPVVVVAPPPLPSKFEIETLPTPGAGKGLRSPVSTVAVPADKLDHPESITSLTIAFPDGARQWQFKSGELDGVFGARSTAKESLPRLHLHWKDSSGLAPQTPVAVVTLDTRRHQLEVTWSNSTMLRSSELTNLAYWVLQNSTLKVSDDSGQRTQRITFMPPTFKPMRLTDPDFAGSMPDNLPMPPELHIGKSDPEGWVQGTPAPATVDTTKKESDTLLLRIEKPPGRAGIVPAFTLRYSPSHRTLSSDLAKVIEAAKAELDAVSAESAKARTEIQQIRDNFQPGTTAIEQGIKDWTQKKEASAAAPQPGDLTQEQFQSQIDKMKTDLQNQAVQLSAAIAPAAAQQKDADDHAAALNEALAAYGDLKQVEINLDLPQGLHAGTIRLSQEGN